MKSQSLWVLPRAFPKYPYELPCFHPTGGETNLSWLDYNVQHTPVRTGLFFVKLLKTASSTGAGVHIRIAQKLAQRLGTGYPACQCRFSHGQARKLQYAKLEREKSFLWSILREPTARYLSEFFHFQHSRKGAEATDQNILQFLQEGKNSNHHQIQWLHLRSGEDDFGTAGKIVEDYDFLGLAERMDESLVALHMILDVPLSDVLYISAKVSGGYDDGGYHGKCFRIRKSSISPGVQTYLDGDEWQTYIKPEMELYRAVNSSLDLTIELLGRSVFDEHLRKFREAMQRISQVCEPSIRLPCTKDGIKRPDNETDCVRNDLGCGFDCLDRVAAELDLRGSTLRRRR